MRRGLLRAAAVFALLVVIAGGVYVLGRAAGVLEFDGTGVWPRFGVRERDAAYARLESHREGQQQLRSSPAAVAPELVRGEEPTGPGAPPAEVEDAPGAPDEPAPGDEAPPAGEPFPGDEALPRRELEGGAPGAREWTDFRGPARDGRYDAPIAIDWAEDGPPLLWRQPIGGGYASFVAVEGRAWTIEQRRGQEVVTAYDVATGRELWAHGWDAEFRETMGGDGPRATPTWHDGRIYALGATGELRCLDAATGRLIWRRDILADAAATNLTWAMSAAPLVVDDMVVVLPGGSGGGSVVAYDRLSGQPVWRSLDDRQAYTSPMLVTLAGERQLLVVSAERAVGLAIADGALLWEFPWRVSMVPNIAQPVLLDEDRVFLSAGYGHGAAVFQVVREAGRLGTRQVWRNIRMKNKFASSVLHGGYIYGLDEAILACLDAATGEQMWKAGRYGYGQLVLAGDHLVITAENGDLVLVEATPEGHHERARIPALRGKTWNHPAVADGVLLIRNTTEMAAFDLRP